MALKAEQVWKTILPLDRADFRLIYSQHFLKCLFDKAHAFTLDALMNTQQHIALIRRQRIRA